MINHPAYKYSINLLSRRNYSCAKLKQKLIARNHEDIADEVIEYLVTKKFLREDLYIEGRIISMMNKNYSPSYILSKLKEEDLDSTLNEIIDVFDSWKITEQIQIQKLVRKKSLLYNWHEDDIALPKNVSKLARFLYSKGHDWESVKDSTR